MKEIIPKFSASIEIEEVKESILKAEKEQLKGKLDHLYKELERDPSPFYEIQIQHEEGRLSKLSMFSLREEANQIFDEIIRGMLREDEAPNNPARENYICTSFLKILYEEFKRDAAKARKYHATPKSANKLYKYYKSLDVDLDKVDRQFSKYDLLSISRPEQIISGLPNRIFDDVRNAQFLVDIPETLLKVFAALLSSDAIRRISFLVQSEVVFETSANYFILLGNEESESPVLLADFLNDSRGDQATRDVIKKDSAQTTFPPQMSAGRSYDKSGDSAWYFIDDPNIYLEEIPNDPLILDDWVVTRLIHIEYFVRDGRILLSHVDHEYIFYSYEEFDRRLEDFSQKGNARKRIKTFKIDDSEIPLVGEDGVLVLNTMLGSLFEKPYLFNEFLREITYEASSAP